MPDIQYGVNTGLLIQPPSPTDFVAGGTTAILPEIRRPGGDWYAYLPADEMQIGTYFDTMACVTFSALNSVETQVNFLIGQGLMPADVLAELTALGFIKDGKFEASDRFTAKMSGTTHQGNYLVKVWDSIKNHGLVPEADWPYPRLQRQPVFDWDDYYTEIPQALKDKALKVKELLDIKYEWLTTGTNPTQMQFADWLKVAPIQIATATCPPWNTQDIIAGCSLAVGHATLMYRVDPNAYNIMDQYEPFKKRLGFDYPIPYALRGVVSIKTKPSMPIDPTFGKKLTGKLLLAVEDHGALWYVTPDGKRAKIGRTPEDVAAFLELINQKKVPVTGISNNDLAKVATIL